jgi:hypothetical protein
MISLSLHDYGSYPEQYMSAYFGFTLVHPAWTNSMSVIRGETGYEQPPKLGMPSPIFVQYIIH